MSADGIAWFTRPAEGRVGRRGSDGIVREFVLPEASEPTGIAVARDGAAWVAERRGNRLVRVSPDGEVTAWPLATPNAQPDAISFAPDGTVWAALPNARRIARVSPRGTLEEISVDNAPSGIAVAPDGGVWFAAPTAKKLGRLEPETGKVAWTPLPDGPVAVSTSADGTVWVVLGIGDKLGRIEPKR